MTTAKEDPHFVQDSDVSGGVCLDDGDGFARRAMAGVFAESYQRILETTGARSQSGLARILGVTQGSVGDALRRGASIPPGWLVALTDIYGTSPRWIRTGTGPRILRALEEVSIEDLCAEIVRRSKS